MKHMKLNLVASLKTCADHKDLEKGSKIHADIIMKGLLKDDILIGNNLINMYAKCGEFTKAQQVFDDLPVRNVVSCNALINGYVQHGLGKEALECFEQMCREGFSPNSVTFSCILKACGNIGSVEKGKEIHSDIKKEGFLENNTVLCNALVDMYAKCGALLKARETFDEVVVRDVVAYTALIAGYTQHGHSDDALTCFQRLELEGLLADKVAFSCIVKACGNLEVVTKGKHIHVKFIRKNDFKDSNFVGNALVDMYAKCGDLVMAQKVFDELHVRDIVSWTSLISGYAQHSHGEKALDCFEQMLREGLTPDSVTYLCILKACGSVGAIRKGKEIHAELNREGLLQQDWALRNALVDMYAKCGLLTKAQELFDKLPVRDLVSSWNALLTGYVQNGHAKKTLWCYDQMRREGISPNAVTFTCILKACGVIGSADKGKEIHAEIAREGLLIRNSIVATTLVDMYAKCGELAQAQEVFNELNSKDLVSWTTLIAGYAEHGQGEDALNTFEHMESEGLCPDAVTFLGMLKACGSMGVALKGLELHAEIARGGFMGNNTVIGNALVDMYAKCGALGKAQEIFEKLPARDVASWTSLIAGYGQVGNYITVSKTFKRMVHDGIEPDLVTFTVLLNACSFSGLMNEAQTYFETMSRCYGIFPTLEHHTCMLDLFSRAGHFDMAEIVIKRMPSSDYLPAWFALLTACQKWGNTNLGKLAFQNAVRLDETCALPYVYMKILYSAGMKHYIS